MGPRDKLLFTICLSARLSVYLSVCPSVCLTLRSSVCLSVLPEGWLERRGLVAGDTLVDPSVCLSLCPSVCLTVRLSACLSAHLSVFVSVCLSDSPSVCLSVRPSVCLSYLTRRLVGAQRASGWRHTCGALSIPRTCPTLLLMSWSSCKYE